MLPFGIQPWHILAIIVVAFLIFGATKLPEMGRSLGKTITQFRKGTKEAAKGFKEELQKNAETPAAPAQTAFPDPTQSPQPTGNFCIHCGAANMPEARFCNLCGTKLSENVIKPSDPSILG